MSNSKISTKEAISIILSIIVAHILVCLPRNIVTSTKSATLINLIYVGIIAILIVFLIIKLLKRFPSNDIIDISDYLGGPVFKKIIGFLFIGYFIFSSSILLRNFCECLKIVYYPMTSLVFIILTFIIAILITLNFSFKTSAKVNLLILPVVIFSVLFIFIANFRHFSIGNIFPILGDGIFNTFVTGIGNLSAFSGIVFIYFLPPYLEEPQKLKKISVTAIGIAIIYLILCVSIILLLFSSLLKADEILPLYSAAQYIEFGVFFQRLESIFLLIWMIQMACYFAIVLHFTLHIFKKIANLSDSKPLIFPLGLLMFAVSFLPKNYAVSKFLEVEIYPYLVFGIGFFISISILILANMKKRKKKVEVQNNE